MASSIQPEPIRRNIGRRIIQSALAVAFIFFGLGLWDMIVRKGTDGLGLAVLVTGGAVAGALVGLVAASPLFSRLDRVRRGDFEVFPALVKAVADNDVAMLRHALHDPRLNVRLAAMGALARLRDGAGFEAVPELLTLLAGRSPAGPVSAAHCAACGAPLTRWNADLTGRRSGTCGRCLRDARISGVCEAAIAARTLGCLGSTSSEVSRALTEAAHHANAEISGEARAALNQLRAGPETGPPQRA